MELAEAIWVAGYPSFFGGADTELDHNIDLWRQHGVDVNLVPMGGYDPSMRPLCDRRGCITHRYRPGIFKDKVVVSFCNGEFLRTLPEIIESGRPRFIVWFNCMTWTFPDEVAAHTNGWITHFGFVSNYQREQLSPHLRRIAPLTELEGYRPFFNPDSISQRLSFQYRPPIDHFAIGRVSRDDAAKFAEDTWQIFHRVCSPKPKKVFMLGYGDNAHTRCGDPPVGLDWMTWTPNAIPVSEFYSRLHCLIHKTGGSRESYGRFVPEAYATGVPVIVEDDFAFPELVINGITGFRCSTSDEMSFRASELAFNEERRRQIILSAQSFLHNEVASPSRCWKAWEQLLNL